MFIHYPIARRLACRVSAVLIDLYLIIPYWKPCLFPVFSVFHGFVKPLEVIPSFMLKGLYISFGGVIIISVGSDYQKLIKLL